MSEENLLVVRRAFEAWQRGDTEALIALADPDVEVHVPDNPETQTWRGRDGALAAMASWTGAFEDYGIEVESLEAEGDRVLAITRQRGRGPASGVEMEQLSPYVMTVRDGRVVRWEIYSDLDEARAAFRREPGR